MPRTRVRKVTKKSETNVTSEKENTYSLQTLSMLKELETELTKRETQLKCDYQNMLYEIDLHYDKIVASMSKSNLMKTIPQLKEIESVSLFTSAMSSQNSILCSKNSDEGYLTESADTLPKTGSKSVKKATFANSVLNVSNSVLKNTATKTPFKTPLCRNGLTPGMTLGYITPKIQPNRPLTVLRRPKQGELVISMSGSPLLVSSVVTEEYANVNIPLKDGRIVSVQPNARLRMSEIPEIDSDTKMDLEMLRDNLNTLMANTKD